MAYSPKICSIFPQNLPRICLKLDCLKPNPASERGSWTSTNLPRALSSWWNPKPGEFHKVWVSLKTFLTALVFIKITVTTHLHTAASIHTTRQRDEVQTAFLPVWALGLNTALRLSYSQPRSCMGCLKNTISPGLSQTKEKKIILKHLT